MNRRNNAGFSVVELTIVLGIVAVITSVIIAGVKSSKEKGATAEIKTAIAQIALTIASYDTPAGVEVDYQAMFEQLGLPEKFNILALKYGIPANQYRFVVTPSSYAIVFPLKNGKWYCMDSYGQSAPTETTGIFLKYPLSCANAIFEPQ